jgi:hypothetical protein
VSSELNRHEQLDGSPFPILGVRIKENALLEVPFKPFSDSLEQGLLGNSALAYISAVSTIDNAKPHTAASQTSRSYEVCTVPEFHFLNVTATMCYHLLRWYTDVRERMMRWQ